MDGVLIMKILYGIMLFLFFIATILFAKVIVITSTMEDKSKKACKNSH